MYDSRIKESVVKVEETRSRRLKEVYRRMPEEDKNSLLKFFHPDFISEAMREIGVGPNKGDRTPKELADLLEGKSLIRSGNIDLSSPDYDVDVLVIGGGGAAASSALTLQNEGVNLLLVTKLRFGDANTIMAQGGIQAATKKNDSPAIHYLDVLGGGRFVNVPELVEALVSDASEVMQWLESLGCFFDKESDGTLLTIHGGGTSRKRMHTARDYTGVEIMRTLRDEVLNRKINVVEFSPAIELLLDETGSASGAILMNLETKEMILVRAKAVILATGGGGRLHYQGFPTTNHYGATADGLVLAYRLGAKLIFMDTMQYHPTGVAFPEQILGQLITEKVRSLGAQLVNINGEQFINALETRDIVSSGIIRECKERHLGIKIGENIEGVWLDSPIIDVLHGLGTVVKELPAMYRQFSRFGIDMSKDPVLTYPTLHYQNGGIKINEAGATNIPGLFAAGEVTGGVHGRNRLMGNSLLDILVFGRRAGKSAADFAKGKTPAKLTMDHLKKWREQLKESGAAKRQYSPLLLPDYTRILRRVKHGSGNTG